MNLNLGFYLHVYYYTVLFLNAETTHFIGTCEGRTGVQEHFVSFWESIFFLGEVVYLSE